jgi:peptidoglycan/LPS O-acetylase OafA/YrhL
MSVSRRESIYLDFVRALAAFLVVLDHAPTLFDLPNGPRWGHQAVMVFFVLSGYVICNVADNRKPMCAASWWHDSLDCGPYSCRPWF